MLPPASPWPKWIAIALLVVVAIAIGIAFSRGANLGADALRDWVLFTGGCAALGALAGGGHPLSVLVAFVVAPLKPFRPGVPSGALSAATELWLHRPRVADFDALRDDVIHWTGWWKNRVSRTLLVFLLTNLGTMIGEYLAGFHIVKSLFWTNRRHTRAMKLSGFLNKPRWQAKEPAVRRAGVADDDDAELLASLASIAREDPDPSVRSAALKRLADAALTQRVAHEDPDPGVRSDARKLWFDLLAGTHANAPAPRECERLLRAQDDAALIEHVARTATDSGLRAAALARVTRVALLAERVTADPAHELRLAALERIDDESLLERLAERTRKTDKRVSRRARDRADALRIARGDSAVAETVARTLCERLEKLVREPQAADAAAAIDAQWTIIEARAGEALRARYRAARTLLTTAREAPAPAAEPPAYVPTAAPAEPLQPEIAAEIAASEQSDSIAEPTALEPSDSGDAFLDPIADPLLAQAALAPPGAADDGRQQEQEQRRAATVRAENAVAAFESAVADGVVARAHAAHAELATLRKEAGVALTRALQRRVADAERRTPNSASGSTGATTSDAASSANRSSSSPAPALHPDAIATRVREAQAEWSRLDVAEGHVAHGQAVHGWARRFHAACRRALEPAKSYFRKRQELRKTHAQAMAASLDAANGISADSTDWPLIAKARHAIVDSLRALDGVDPHERKVLAKNLKTALTALDARLIAHHRDIERAKSALIAEAEALGADESRRGAAGAARALQQRWQEIGNGRRDRDQAQWRAFRAALDAVFGKLDTERSQRTAREADSRARVDALCVELEQLASADARPQRSAVSRIEAEWDSLRVRDESLLRRFRAAQSALRDAGMRQERATRRGPYEAWMARYALCRAAESSAEPAADLRASWDAALRGDIAAAALAARFEAALQEGTDGTPPAGEAEEEHVREVLIRLEIFAGLESPREDQDHRRALQVERLFRAHARRGRGHASPGARRIAYALDRSRGCGIVRVRCTLSARSRRGPRDLAVTDGAGSGGASSTGARPLNDRLMSMRAAQARDPVPDWTTRAKRLRTLEALMLDNRAAIAAAINADFGRRPREETEILEVFPSLSGVHHALRHGRRWMRPRRHWANFWFLPARTEVRPQPLGVVGIIAPWNYPLYLAIGPMTDALAAGNRVMVKMSEYTPRFSALFAEIMAQCFRDDEVVVVNGDAQVGRAFAALPFDHLLFTGSTAVGRDVMAAAAANLTPVTLELGGKSPALIGPGARFTHAVDRIVLGKLLNAGQTCIAPDYVLLPRAQMQHFIEAAREAAMRFYPDLPRNAQYSSIVSNRHYARLCGLRDDAIAAGAKSYLLGAAGDDADTRTLSPVVLTDVDERMEVMRQEIFGPLLPLVPYDTLDEALDHIARHPHPLAFYAFEEDRATIERILDRTQAGGVTINDTILHIAQHSLPFGGAGASGLGTYHGESGFRTFSRMKPIMRQTRVNAVALLNPPYGHGFRKVLKILLRR